MFYDVRLTPQQKDKLLKEGSCYGTGDDSYFITGKELRKELEQRRKSKMRTGHPIISNT